MTHSDAIDTSGGPEQTRRTRVVILGEFSAGKSTLINLFTEGNNLRTVSYTHLTLPTKA